MKIHETLTNLGATKNQDLFGNIQYIMETKIGLLYITLNKKYLSCNFIGSEAKARAKFGHWKQNTFIENERDIINHINRLKK